MTRLSEALERARVIPPESRDVPGSGETARQMREEVPGSWKFGAEQSTDPLRTETSTPRSYGDPGTYAFADNARNKLVIGSQADEGVAEQFRRLAAALHHAQLQHGVRSVMVTSAASAEGKTLVASNLALTLSHSYQRRVLLIDADLRRPSIHEVFQLANHNGLGESLRNSDEGRLPIQAVLPRLWILPGGAADHDPMGILTSKMMKDLLVSAARQFDWVVVDTPPVALLPDANLLAAMIDSALMVVSAKSAPYPLVQHAIEAIAGTRILGVVFNRVDRSLLPEGYGAYYGLERSTDRRNRPHGFRLFGKQR